MMNYVATTAVNKFLGSYLEVSGFKSLSTELIEIENAIIKTNVSVEKIVGTKSWRTRKPMLKKRVNRSDDNSITALSDAGLPIAVRYGRVGNLKLHIPGGLFALVRGYHDIIKVEIEDLYLLVDKVVIAGAKAQEVYEHRKAADLELDSTLYNQKLLELLDTTINSTNNSNGNSSGSALSSTSSAGIIQQLLDAIFQNGQFELRRVHIRYEDTTSNPDEPFAVGLTLDRFLTAGHISTNETNSTVNTPVNDSTVSSSNTLTRAGSAGIGPGMKVPMTPMKSTNASSSSTFPADNLPENGLMHRTAQIERLAIYWDPLTSSTSFGNVPDPRSLFMNGLSSTVDHYYMLIPMSPSLSLVWNYRHLPNYPGMKVNLVITQLRTCITTSQYRGLIFLQSWLADAKMKEMRRNRPLPPAKPIPGSTTTSITWENYKRQRSIYVRARWRYAVELVLAMKSQFIYKPERWTLARIIRKGSVKECYAREQKYKETYRAVLEATTSECKKALAANSSTPAKIDEKLLAALKELEKPLFYDTILLWRTVTRLSYEQNLVTKMQSITAPTETSGGGGIIGSLYSFFGGSSSSSSSSSTPANDTKPTDTVKTPVRSKTNNEPATPLTIKRRSSIDQTEIDRRLAEARSATDTTIFMDATAELRAATFMIAKDRGSPILTASFSGQAGYTATKGKTFTASLTIPDLQVNDAVTKDSRFANMITKRRTPPHHVANLPIDNTAASSSSSSSSSSSLLHIVIENCPTPDIDLRINVKSQPLVVVFAPECVRALAKFAVVPPSAAAVRSAASATITNLQQQIAADTYAALESRKRMQFDAHIAAPVVILPENIRKADSRRLILQLGDVNFRSAKAETERTRRNQGVHSSNSRILDTISLDKNYDTWVLNVTNVAAKLQIIGTGVNTSAHVDNIDGEPIIEPINVDLCFQTCIQPAIVSSNRLRAHGALPRLAVRVSLPLMQQLHALQLQFDELAKGMDTDYNEVQKEFKRDFAAAGIAEDDAAVQGLALVSTATAVSNNSTVPPTSTSITTNSKSVPSTPVPMGTRTDEENEFVREAAIIADFSIGTVVLELFDIRTSANKEIILQRQRIHGYPPVSYLLENTKDSLNDHSSSDLSLALSGLSFGVAYGRIGAYASATLAGMECIDRYQRHGTNFQYLVSSTHCPAGVPMDPYYSVHSTDTNLISVNVSYRTNAKTDEHEIPLVADVNFRELHIGYNPETIAAVQLYAYYLSRFFATENAKSVSPPSTASVTAPVPSLPPVVPTSTTSIGSGTNASNKAPTALMNSIAAALDDDEDDDDPDLGKGLSRTKSTAQSSTSTTRSQTTTATDCALPLYVGCPIQMHITARLGAVTLTMQKERMQRKLSTFIIGGLRVLYDSTTEGDGIEASLAQICLVDTCTENTRHPLLLGKSIPSYDQIGTKPGTSLSTKVTNSAPMVWARVYLFRKGSTIGNGHDTLVEAKIAHLRFVYLQRAILEIADYALSGLLGTLVTSAAQLAGTVVADAAVSRTKLDITIDDIVLYVPIATTSLRSLAFDMGTIKVVNAFVKDHKAPLNIDTDTTIERMSVNIGNLGIYSLDVPASAVDNYATLLVPKTKETIGKEGIKEPSGTLEITIQRASNPQYHRDPAMDIGVKYDGIMLKIGRNQFSLLQDILTHNIGGKLDDTQKEIVHVPDNDNTKASSLSPSDTIENVENALEELQAIENKTATNTSATAVVSTPADTAPKLPGVALHLNLMVNGDIGLVLRGVPDRMSKAHPQDSLHYTDLIRFAIQNVEVDFSQYHEGKMTATVSFRHFLCCDERDIVRQRSSHFRHLIASADAFVDQNNADSLYSEMEKQLAVKFTQQANGAMDIDVQLEETIISAVPDTVERLLWFLNAPTIPALSSSTMLATTTNSTVLTNAPSANLAPAKAVAPVSFKFRTDGIRFLLPSAPSQSTNFLLLGFKGSIDYGTDGSSPDALELNAVLNDFHLQVVPSPSISQVILRTNDPNVVSTITPVIGPCSVDSHEDGYGSIAAVTLSPTKGTGTTTAPTFVPQKQGQVDVILNYSQKIRKDEHDGASRAEQLLRTAKISAKTIGLAISFSAANVVISALDFAKAAGLLDLPGKETVASTGSGAETVTVRPASPSLPAKSPYRIIDNFSVNWDGLQLTLLDDAATKLTYDHNPLVTVPNNQKLLSNASLPVSSALSAPALLQARLQKLTLTLDGQDELYKLTSAVTVSLRAWDRVKRSLQPLIQDQWIIGVKFTQTQTDRHAPPATLLSIVATSPLLMSITDRFLIHSAAGLSRWSASLTEVVSKSTVLGTKTEDTRSDPSPSSTVIPIKSSDFSSVMGRTVVANRLRSSLRQCIVIEIPLVRLEVAVDIDEKRSRPLFRLYAIQLNGTMETKVLLESPSTNDLTVPIHPTVGTLAVSRFGVAGLHIIDRQQQLMNNTDFMFLVTSLPSNDNEGLLGALGVADDKQQVSKLQNLHARTKFYTNTANSTDSRSLVDITLESFTPNDGIVVPETIRGKSTDLGIPVADSLINVDFQQLHIGWNAQAMLEISQLAINMAAEAAEAVRSSTNVSQVPATVSGATTAHVADSMANVSSVSSAVTPSFSPRSPKLLSQIYVRARELSLSMNKESLKRKVVHLSLSGFTFDLQSYGTTHPNVQDEYTLMNGSLRNVAISDLTRGPNVHNYNILSRSNRMLTTGNDPDSSTTDSDAVVNFSIRSLGKDIALRSGTSGIIDVTVHPIQFTYISTLVQEAIDFLSNGMLNLLRLFSPETPVFTELAAANDPVSILQFSTLRITVEEPCVRVPRHQNAKGGLELRLTKATIVNKLEDCLIQEVTLKDQANKLSTRSVRVANEAYLHTLIGRNAAMTSILIDLHDLVAVLVDTFPTGNKLLDTTNNARPPLIRYSREPVQLCISSYQSATASAVAGSTINIALPPLSVCFSDRSYAEFMTVLDGNIAAKPPTLATDKARCLFSRPSIPVAVPKYKDASTVTKCGSCSKPLVLSRNTCEACADIVCLACIAGEVWDEENEDAKRICRTCLARFNEETKMIADMMLNDLDISSILSETPNPRSADTDSIRDDRSSVMYGSHRSENMESSADSTVTFSYGELNQSTGDPLVVRVSLAYAHIDLVKEVSPVLSLETDTSRTSDAPLAKLSLVGAGITYTSLPIATLSETAIELQAVRIIDTRLSRAKAKTRAILIPSASVEDHFSPLITLTDKQDDKNGRSTTHTLSNPASRRNSGSKGHFTLSSTVSNLFTSAVGVPETIKISPIHSTYRPPQLGLTITSSAGGASSLAVNLNSSDINPDVPAILEIISFFTANRAAVPVTEDTMNTPKEATSQGNGTNVPSTATAMLTTTNSTPLSERIINIRIPSPQQEMDITVNIHKVRIVIMQDATLENTQALLLGITAKVELDLYTSAVVPRIFAGINPLWLRMCNARFPKIGNANSTASSSNGTTRTGKELVTRPLPYNPGYLARGKLQDNRMKASVDLIEVSLDRMRIELASPVAMRAPPSGTNTSLSSSFVSSSSDNPDPNLVPHNNTFGNLDSLRIPIIRPFGLQIEAKTYATTVTQIDLQTLTDPLIAPSNVIEAFDLALQNEVALMNSATSKSKRGGSSSSSTSVSSSSGVSPNALPSLRTEHRNRRHIDISNCVAIRSLPRERTTIDVKSTHQIAAALALSDIDLVTAVVNGWMQAISAHNEQTAQDEESKSSSPSPPSIDPTQSGANPLALAAAAAGVRLFVVPEEWHPDDYEIIVPALSTKLGIQWQTRTLGFDSKDDTYPGESKVNILLADTERISTADRTAALNGTAFDSGDGRFIRGTVTPIEAAGILRPYDALVGINGVPLISFPDMASTDTTNKPAPNIMLRKDVERTLSTIGTPVRVLRFRSFPYVVAGRLDEGISVGLIAKNSGLEREVVRIGVHNFLFDLYGNPTDFSKYVEADLNPARKAILADEQDPSLSSPSSSSSTTATTPPKPWMKEPVPLHARGSLSSGAVNMGGRASDLVVRSRSLAQVRRRRSLVIAQVQRRPAVQSVFGTLKLSICADGHNPRNSYWEPILESWRIQMEGSMFDNVYRRNHRENNSALKLQAPMRILNVSADPLRLSISEDLYKSLLRALSDVSSNRSSTTDAGTAATMGSLLAGLRAGDLVQSDLPPSACPYVIRNETGLRVALTYMPAAGRKEGVMWSRSEYLASVGPLSNNKFTHVSTGLSAKDTPDDAFSMRSKRRGATIVPPHSEVGLAVGNYDRHRMLPLENTSTMNTSKTNTQALLPVPSTHLLCVDLDGAADIVRDINIDAEGISAYNIKLYEPRSANETIVQMCVQTIVTKGRKLITLRSGVAIHNYSGIDLEVYADIHRMPVYVGTVAGRNSLAVPMDKLSTNSLRIRPALTDLPDNTYELSQPINVNREGLHELTCKSSSSTVNVSKSLPNDTSIPNRRFAIRTYYRGKNRYLCVAIHSPVSIFNGLPLRLEYDIRSTGMGSGTGSIAPGETTDIFDVSGGAATCGPNEGPAEPELRIRISGYEWSRWWNLGTGEYDYNRSDIELYLQEKARTALSRPLHLTTESRVWFPGFGILPWSDDGTTGLASNRTKKKAGNLPSGTGRLDVRIYAPHWIVNLTGLPLTFGERVSESSSQVVAAGMQVTGVQITEEVYENERFYLVNWNSPMATERPNWSNEDGTKAVTKSMIDDNIQKMGGWKWITPWTAEGWDYETIGFDNFRHADHGGRHHFNPEYRPGDIVRRRKWYRVRERLPEYMPSSSSSSLSSSSTIARVPGAPHGMRLTAGGLRSSSRLVSGFRLGTTPDMEADSVVLFSPMDGDLFIRIGAGRWTPGIPMNIENANGRLHEHILLEGSVEKGIAPNGAPIETMPGYTLALVRETAPPPFEATNCITIMPAFMIVNATNNPLRWRQAVPGPSLLPTMESNTQPECEVPPVSYSPVWWTRGRYDVPKHIQFSPSSANGGWSPPMYVSRIEDRPSVDVPLAITIPGDVPYVRTVGSGKNYSLSAVGTVVIGVSVRPLPLVNGGTMLVVTQQTHPAAPLRPPVYVMAGNIVSGGEANTLARSFGLDAQAQEDYRRERLKRSSHLNLTPSVATSAPSTAIDDHMYSLIEVTRPYIAFVNHSKCVLAFKQIGARVLHKWGGVMAKDEVTKDHALPVLFKKLTDLDGKLPAESLGGAFAFSTTYVPPNSVVPVGLVDPQAVIDARGRIHLKVYAMDISNEVSTATNPPSFGPGVTVDLSHIESPVVLPTNVNGGTAVVIEVRLHGPTRKIVVYDEDRPVAVPKVIKSPRRDSTDSWEIVTGNGNPSTANRTASGDWETGSDTESVTGAQDAGALADALDFGTGNDAISASLNNLRNGVGWETSRDLGNSTPITSSNVTSLLATPTVVSSSGTSPAAEVYKVRMWRESYRVNIEEISLSVIMNETYGPSEIAHVNFGNIGLRYRGTPSQHSWLFGIQRFQIDDQDPNAYFPVVVAIGRPLGGRPPMPFFQARLRTIPRLDRDIIGPLAGDFASYIDGLHVTLAAMDVAPLRVRLSYEFLTRIIHGIGNLDRARQDYAEERQRSTIGNEDTNDIGGNGTIEDAADVDMPSSIVTASKDNGIEEGQNTIRKLLRYRAAMDLDDEGVNTSGGTVASIEATRSVLLRLLEGHRLDPFQALSFMDVASLGKLSLIVELKLGSSSTTTKVYDDDIKLLLHSILPGRSMGMVTARRLIRRALRLSLPIPTTPITVRPVAINGDFTSLKKFIQLLIDTASDDMKNILPNILGNSLLLSNTGQFISKLSTDTLNMTDALAKGNATGVFSSGVSALKTTIGGTVGLVSGVSDAIGSATDTLANSSTKTPIPGTSTPRTPDIAIPNDNSVANQILGDGKPKNVLHGLTLGVFSATANLAKGVVGVVTKPVEGAVKEGTVGFSKGLASGVKGLIAAPVLAATSGVSNVLQGIQAHVTDDKESNGSSNSNSGSSSFSSSSSSSTTTTTNASSNTLMDPNAIIERVRLPRVFYGQSSILRPYSTSDAQVLADLRSTTDAHIMRIMGTGSNDHYVPNRTKLVGTVELMDDYQEGNLLCILSTHLIILKSTNNNDGRQWSARWQISLNDVFGVELTETRHDRTDLAFETIVLHLRRTGRSGGMDTVPKRIVLAPGLPGLAENVRLQIEESKLALDTTMNVTPVSPSS